MASEETEETDFDAALSSSAQAAEDAETKYVTSLPIRLSSLSGSESDEDTTAELPRSIGGRTASEKATLAASKMFGVSSDFWKKKNSPSVQKASSGTASNPVRGQRSLSLNSDVSSRQAMSTTPSVPSAVKGPPKPISLISKLSFNPINMPRAANPQKSQMDDLEDFLNEQAGEPRCASPILDDSPGGSFSSADVLASRLSRLAASPTTSTPSPLKSAKRRPKPLEFPEKVESPSRSKVSSGSLCTNVIDKKGKFFGDKSIHQYQIVKILGKGAHGKVLLAQSSVDSALYAIKVLDKQQLAPVKSGQSDHYMQVDFFSSSLCGGIV